MKTLLSRLCVIPLLLSAITTCRASQSPSLPVISEDEVQVLTQILPQKPATIAPDIDAREYWNGFAAAAGIKSIITPAEKLLASPPDPPTRTDWEITMKNARKRSGNNKLFNDKLNRMRNDFNTLVIAECVENRQRFIPMIEIYISEFGKFHTFVVPYHDRSSSAFSGKARFVELGSAPLMATLGMTSCILRQRLSVNARDTIQRLISEWLVTPTLESMRQGSPTHGMGWLNGQGNWNPVCLVYSLAAVLSNVESRRTRAQILAFYAACAESYINSYPDDGYCSEGMAYWVYGFTHYLHLAELTAKSSRNHYNLFKHPKVSAAAAFGINFAMSPNTYPQFSDTTEGADITPFMRAMISLRCDPPLYPSPNPQNFNYRQHNNLLTSMLWFNILSDLRAHSSPVQPPQPPPFHYFNDSGVVISRAAPDEKVPFSFAIKAGHNAELHNHNDVGSFDVALGPTHMLGDSGAPEYDMNPNRYEKDLHGSQGHPVPLVAGRTQKAGRDASGDFTGVKLNDSLSQLTIDLKRAYEVPELLALSRHAIHDRLAREITITDKVSFSSPQAFGGALPSYQDISMESDGVFIFRKGKNAVRASITSKDGKLVFGVTPLNCTRRRDKKARASKVDYAFAAPVTNAEITITIEVLSE